MAKLEQFILYETNTTMYLVGSDNLQVRSMMTSGAHNCCQCSLFVTNHGLLHVWQNQYRIMLMDKTQEVSHRTPLADIVREVGNDQTRSGSLLSNNDRPR